MPRNTPSNASPARTRSRASQQPPGSFAPEEQDVEETYLATDPGEESTTDLENIFAELENAATTEDLPLPRTTIIENPTTSVRSPLPSPSISSQSSDESTPDHSTSAQLLDMSTGTTNITGEATITGINRAKDCPILTLGTVTPKVMLAWRRACKRYMLLNTFTEKIVVETVGGSVQEPHLQEWFDEEKERLTEAGLETYLTEFAKHVLPPNWANRVKDDLLSSEQGDKLFSVWRYEVQNLNSILSMSDIILPLDKPALRAQLTAHMSKDLRQYLAEESFDHITDFHAWATEITRHDLRLRAEKERNARAAEIAFKQWALGQPTNGNAKKKTLLDRLEKTAPTTATSTATPNGGTSKYLPRLTDAEKTLLHEHEGCTRCRKFYANHESPSCPMKATNSWPDASTYMPLTATMAMEAKAKKSPAGIVAMAYNAQQSTTEATVERSPYKVRDYEADDVLDWGDKDTDKYVSNLCFSTPHISIPIDIHTSPCSIHPTPVKAMLDTGCPSTVISSELADELGVRLIDLPSAEDNLHSLSQTPLRSPHYAQLRFSVGGGRWTSIKFAAKIVDSLPVPMILGLSFLKTQRIVIDTELNTVIDKNTGYDIANQKQDEPQNTTLEEAPLPGYLNPVPVLAAIRSKIEDISLNETLALRATELKRRYTDIFPTQLPNVTESLPTDIYHRIRLKDPTFVTKQRPYAAPKRYRDAWKRSLDAHLAAGRLRPSSSAFASPAFCIPKHRNGVPDLTLEPRWVNDYRELNKNTIRDTFPLPRIDDILADCGKGKIFGKMDMTNSFFQTRMHPDDIHLTAVRTPWGLYEWVVMPMGGCNAPATHQRRMTSALRHLIGTVCHVYLDDIIVWSNSIEEHEHNLALVLDALRAANLYCNPAKSLLYATEISFLGHIISGDGIKPDPLKIDRILNWPTPTTTTNLRGFLGLTRYVAAFLPALAEYTSVLTPLTHKDFDKNFPDWLPEHQTAFDAIKELVTGAECLTVIDYDHPTHEIFVTTDASDRRTGAVLSFGESWELARPVAYDSYQLNDAEKHYPTHEKELLAIVKALKKWRSSLLGVHFWVLTDHRTLEYFDSQRDMSSRQMRWSLFLADYDYTIRYIRGEDNTAADALSRMPDDTPTSVLAACSLAYTRSPPTAPAGNHLLRQWVGGVLSITTHHSLRDDIVEGYKTDPHAQQVIDGLKTGSIEGARSDNGLLYVGSRLLIPTVNKVRESFYHLAHDVLGHYGFDKSYASLRSSYYWPNMRRDLEEAYIPSCVECQRNKDRTSKPNGPLHPLPVPDGRFEVVGLDFIGPLPRDEGYDTILSMTDLLGADMQLAPTLATATAGQVGVLLFEYWYCENGLMIKIICDRDALWIAEVWKALHRLTGVNIKMSTAYHPETDGGSERTNKTVVQSIRYMVDQHQKGWVSKLRRLRFAFMNTVNASTGYSPFQLKTGRSPRLIPPIAPLDPEATPAQIKAHALAKQIELDVMEAQDRLQAAKIRQAFHANQHRAPEVRYQIGDLVMLSTENRRRNYKRKGKKRAAKFMPRFDGPYKIVDAFPERSEYTLHLPNSPKTFPGFHASLLKPFVANDPSLFPNREPARPGPIVTEDGLREHVIDRILDARRKNGKIEYLVRWLGYGADDDEWKPAAEMQDTEALDVWEDIHGTDV